MFVFAEVSSGRLDRLCRVVLQQLTADYRRHIRLPSAFHTSKATRHCPISRITGDPFPSAWTLRCCIAYLLGLFQRECEILAGVYSRARAFSSVGRMQITNQLVSVNAVSR